MLLHDFFEGFEVNPIPASQLVLTYDSLPFSFLRSLLGLAFVWLLLHLFGLLVALRLNFDIPGFRQFENFDESLARDESVFGNRVKCTMKVLLAR